MAQLQVNKPTVVDLPYVPREEVEDKKLKKEEKEKKEGSRLEAFLQEKIDQKELTNKDLKYIERYPTVYIYHNDEDPDNPEEHKEKQDPSKSTHNKETKKELPTVYVGETTNIMRRVFEHDRADAKNDERWEQIHDHIKEYRLFVIADQYFNKSLTLDVENRLIGYLMASVNQVNLINHRGNPQGEYYPDEIFNKLFHKIWQELHEQDQTIFGSEEEICDSALFKASPFHRLNREQQDAREQILDAALDHLGINESGQKVRDDADSDDDAEPLLILVQGAAGTGKTVLLSTLFTDFCGVPGFSAGISPRGDDRFSVCIIVNQREQENVYNGIASRLGWQKKSGEAVFKAIPFLNQTSQQTSKGHSDVNYLQMKKKTDVVFIDEAHLLEMRSNQGYSGKNQLVDILKRARVVVAVFDSNQVLRMSQRWDNEQRQLLDPYITGDQKSGEIDMPDPDSPQQDAHLKVRVMSMRLKKQMRMCANPKTMNWLRDLSSGKQIGKLELDTYRDQPYEVRICDSPRQLLRLIEEKNHNNKSKTGLSRVVATYDWPYSSARRNKEGDPDQLWTVNLHLTDQGQWVPGYAPEGYRKNDSHQFRLPWNYELEELNKLQHPDKRQPSDDRAWAEREETIGEAGSIYTIQGFDLNYAGVILGPSVTLKNGAIVIDPTKSENSQAIQQRSEWKSKKAAPSVRQQSKEYVSENLYNEVNVLLTRGVHGLYLFAVDPALQAYLKEMTRNETEEFDQQQEEKRKAKAKETVPPASRE